MSDTEFEIIRRYFTRAPARAAGVIAGIGDDAAVLQVPPGLELVICIDTLVEGVHFPVGTPADAIGHKALAVNLSDLAAMGAEPVWATLALTLPEPDPSWLEGFSRGFFELAARYGVQLVGGDTTRGPLTITVQAHGLVPPGEALLRSGGRPGDHICVTGTLGDAALALRLAEAAPDELRRRLDYPEPRLEAGILLRRLASAVIDVSDGLLADLGHLLERDGLGAELRVDDLPRSDAFLQGLESPAAALQGAYYELPLSGGDDYELCFTVPESSLASVRQVLGGLSCGMRDIGMIVAQRGIRCLLPDGNRYQPAATGYRHFDD